MTSQISIFIIIGVIIFTNGYPVDQQESFEKLKYMLKKFLQNLVERGNYDVSLNPLKERSDNFRDLTKMAYNSKPNSGYYDNIYRNAVSNKDSNNILYNNNLQSSQNLDSMLNKLKTYRTIHKKNCEGKSGLCTEYVWDYNAIETPTTSNRLQEVKSTKKITNSENNNIVLEMLNDLDKTLKLDANDEVQLRCYGNSCGANRDDYNRNSDRDDSGDRDYNNNIINAKYDNNLRCNGKSCSIDRDDDRVGRNSLRCYGNKCSRKPNEENYSDVRNDVRSPIDSIRCIGDRCNKIRNDNNARDNLRCIGDRCSRFEVNDKVRERFQRYNIFNDIYDSRNVIYNSKDNDKSDRLTCIGDRCSRNENEYKARDMLRSKSNDKKLYCIGTVCGGHWGSTKNFNVSKAVVKRLDETLSSFMRAKYVAEESENFRSTSDTKSQARDYQNGLLKLMIFHLKKENPKDSFYDKK